MATVNDISSYAGKTRIVYVSYITSSCPSSLRSTPLPDAEVRAYKHLLSAADRGFYLAGLEELEDVASASPTRRPAGLLPAVILTGRPVRQCSAASMHAAVFVDITGTAYKSVFGSSGRLESYARY